MFENKSEREYLREIDEIGRGMVRWHSLFYEFFVLGEPRITEQIPTAAVTFNREGQFVEFLFNPNFWDSLNSREAKEFVIAHEILHVLYKHGARGKSIKMEDRELANLAMDIEVNNCLVQKFKFNKSLQLPVEPVWVDNSFKPEHKIEHGREFEYYFNKMKELYPKIELQLAGLSTLDQHLNADGDANGNDKDGNDKSNGDSLGGLPDRVADDLIQTVRESMSREENEKLKTWGLEKGFQEFLAKWKAIKVKKGWDTLRIQLSLKGTDVDENWSIKDRRHYFLGNELFLPGKAENDDADNQRVNLWFFQDISGSCISYVDFFFNASLTFPEEKFHVKMHSFDTEVVEIDKKTKLSGGGGTSFHCIENYIESKTRGGKTPYPDAIFVFSDGEAAPFTARHPEKWYWFLEGCCYKEAIPKKSNIFYIHDFVEENK